MLSRLLVRVTQQSGFNPRSALAKLRMAEVDHFALGLMMLAFRGFDPPRVLAMGSLLQVASGAWICLVTHVQQTSVGRILYGNLTRVVTLAESRKRRKPPIISYRSSRCSCPSQNQKEVQKCHSFLLEVPVPNPKSSFMYVTRQLTVSGANCSTKGGPTSSKKRRADCTPGWSLHVSGPCTGSHPPKFHLFLGQSNSHPARPCLEISSSRKARILAMPCFACSGCFLNKCLA